jgi:N-acetyl-alpha-D-muramate 1-phosphate uridylyltransferase
MTSAITHGIILAAGFGTRLRPITDTVPKAMVTISGKPLLGYAIDRLLAAGVEKIIVNTHYLPHVIADYIAARGDARLHIIHEPEILETGGGIKNALPHLGAAPFYAVNADSLWSERGPPLLQQLGTAYQPGMDALLALIENTGQYPELSGDFQREGDGHLRRKNLSKPFPYHFIGAQILHPRLFKNSPDGKFSLNVLYNLAEESETLFGNVSRETFWNHISTPEDWQKANRDFAP